jgi:hypothetical protein
MMTSKEAALLDEIQELIGRKTAGWPRAAYREFIDSLGEEVEAITACLDEEDEDD